jgi:hypothetical protein
MNEHGNSDILPCSENVPRFCSRSKGVMNYETGNLRRYEKSQKGLG